MLPDIIVDDVTDIGNIETSGGNVSRNEYLNMVALEHGQGALTADWFLLP